MEKIVFITGISRGIGEALAKKFLSEGYIIIGTSTSGRASYSHKNLIILKLDLSSEKSIEKCVEDFKKLDKKIDILINNAGALFDEDETQVKLNKLRKTLEINLIGTINLTENLLPSIAPKGKIINISSSAGSLTDQTHSNYPSYSISKAALNMYTRVLSFKLKDISVNSIHPGWVKTDMGGRDATLTPEESANFIFNKIISLKETGKFWFKDKEFPW